MNKAQIKYQEKTKHPWLDCGKLVQKRSSRCPDCAHKARGTVQPKFCIDCGNPISGWFAQRCQSCEQKRRWVAGEVAYLIKREAEHHNWKGGRIRSSGYVFIHRPGHHRANRDGYVREHILVWEETHGKPVPKGWIVHHLNGRKDDNRPKNLEGLPNRKHYLVLQAKAKRIQELEALLNGQSQLL